MPAAARITDNHACPASTGPVAHGGGPIIPPCSVNVRTNMLNQARATDKAMCVGPPDFIVTGSSTVKVNGMMAARQTDKCMHGGQIAAGSRNVNIGGPRAGATLGNPMVAAVACVALRNGRTSNSVQQTNNNCGIESCRLIVNQTGRNRSEDDLMDEALAEDDATEERSRVASGGTSPGDRRSILRRNGVASTNRSATMTNITQAVAERRGVITSHEVKILWGGRQSGGHAINVIGLEYDSNGNLLNVLTSDTGLGNCGRRVPAGQFERSLRSGRDANITDNPIW
ncbi:MAG: PAAR domain-containing protein [Bryobacteraceae bacterium]